MRVAEQGAVVISFRWWVMPYVQLVMGFAQLVDREPDVEKLKVKITSGIKVRCIPCVH